MRIAIRRRVWSLGFVFALLGTAAFLVSPAQAVAPQFQCTAPGVTPGSFCTAVYPTPWIYDTEINLVQPPRTYASMAETVSAWQVWLVNHGRCGPASLTQTNLDHTPGPWMTVPGSSPGLQYGLPVIRQHRLAFEQIVFNNGSPPCTTQWSDYFTHIRLDRDVVCPGGYTLIYEAGPPVIGPYCALEWTKVDQHKCPGGCSRGQIEKGNPGEIASGNKRQVELDYAGGALRFQRYYNSLAQKNYIGRRNPFGRGWSGDYLQKVDYYESGSLATAWVIRPDGRQLPFNASGTSFVPPADINIALAAQRDLAGTITGWTLTTENDDTETYSAAGKLLTIVSRSGRTLTLQYVPLVDVLQSVTDDFGHQLQFTFDISRRLTKVTNPAGGFVQFAYNANNTLNTATYPDGTVRQYHYIATIYQPLAGITDENGQRYSTYSYYGGTSGKLASTELAGTVNRYQFTYNASNTVVTDPRGTARTYGVSVVQNVPRITSSTQLCQGCGEAKTVSYDANGNVSVRKDFNNIETHYSYDLARNLETSRTEAFGTPRARTITTSWHASLRVPTLITEPNRTTGFTYDSSGNVLTRTVTDTAASQSRTWTYTYDGFGRMLTEDGPRTDVSDVTTYAYYTCTTGIECGQVHTVTNALSQVTTFNTYNVHGQPLTITDPNGAVTTLTYDLRQRLTSRDVDGDTTTFEYWPTGLLKKTTLPDGAFILNTYDNAHRLFKIEDGEGNRIQYTLDNMGNRTAENIYDPSSTLARTRTQVFNSLNQLWKQLGAAGTAAVTTTYGYDSEGNQTSANAPLSRNTAQLYDELNRLKQITDPGSGVTQFTYDANDNLASVTDPRTLVTSYSYNGFGDLTQQVSPDTGTTVNTYDSGGNLATTTDARSKTGTHSYDALNRVSSVAYPDRTITYTYDSGTNGIGRLTGASASDHSLAWTYDAQGRVTGKGQTVGAVTKSAGYGYTDGNLTSLVTPSGQTITYGYTNGRIDSITLNGGTTILSDVLYEPFGPVAGWTWGNSTIAARVHDLDGKPTDVDSAGAYTYAYDNAFRITGITDTADSTKTWSYGYDVLDRLNSASRTAETIGYTYDANGNRLSQTGTTTGSYTVSGASNRVTSITGTPARIYGYDASGNVTGYAGLSFTYTDAGRMSSVTSGAITTSYLVNALGQRVKKSNASTTLLFVYDEAGHLWPDLRFPDTSDWCDDRSGGVGWASGFTA